MKLQQVCNLVCMFGVLLVGCGLVGVNAASVATVPPKGWNSWDSYHSSVNESAFKANAQYMADNLLIHGWEYVIVDSGWYTNDTSGKVSDDGYARLIPDPIKWPSTAGGLGWKPIADWVHGIGLKFGIHVMRGIHSSVVLLNEPIYGTNYTAQDIAVEGDSCVWWTDWYGVNFTHPAAQLYYASLVEQYTAWGIDYIKLDCVFGSRDGHEKDIMAVATAIQTNNAEIVYSISPGVGVTPQMATDIQQFVNMYRITNDLWPCWDNTSTSAGCYSRKFGDYVTIAGDFSVFSQYQQFIGASGLNGNSWPDGDMLPLGYTAPIDQKIPCPLTQDEQISVFTLWTMFKSPLIFGGDLTMMDDFTLSVLTNDEVLTVHNSSLYNQQMESAQGIYTWRSVSTTQPATDYVAIFNTQSTQVKYMLQLSHVGLKSTTCFIRDLWAQQNLGNYTNIIPVIINTHATVLYAISDCTFTHQD